jgi:hypothetical protein
LRFTNFCCDAAGRRIHPRDRVPPAFSDPGGAVGADDHAVGRHRPNAIRSDLPVLGSRRPSLPADRAVNHTDHPVRDRRHASQPPRAQKRCAFLSWRERWRPRSKSPASPRASCQLASWKALPLLPIRITLAGYKGGASSRTRRSDVGPLPTQRAAVRIGLPPAVSLVRT